jgi:hypothetical protein
LKIVQHYIVRHLAKEFTFCLQYREMEDEFTAVKMTKQCEDNAFHASTAQAWCYKQDGLARRWHAWTNPGQS